MRAIVKTWNGVWVESGTLRADGQVFRDNDGFLYHINDCEIINEDEWDAEIYALLLIESGVIYE